MKWAGHVARMMENKKRAKFLVGIFDEKRFMQMRT
jgi:hypothetical protein